MSVREEVLDVLVVGGGPTGLVMASELLRHGARCRVIEVKPAAERHSKAISLSASTLQVLDHMGVAEEFVAKGQPVRDIAVHVEGKRFLRLDYGHLAKQGSPFPYLLSLPQPDSEAILERHLAKHGGVLERGVSLANLRQRLDHVEVDIIGVDGATVRQKFRYVVGCDGSRSQTRQLLGIPFMGAPYDVSFIHGDFNVEFATNWRGRPDQVHYFVSKNRFGLVIPMAGGRHRVVVQVEGANPESTYPNLKTEDFLTLLSEAGAPTMSLSKPAWLSHAKLYHFLADSYRKGRVFIAGDAAHLFSPIGGQGMNTGIQDAFNLAWKMAHAVSGSADESILDTYEAERRPIAAALLKSGDDSTQLLLGRTEGRADLILLQEALAPKLRNRAKLRAAFPGMFSGIKQSYQIADAAAQGGEIGRPGRAGERAPNCGLARNAEDSDLFLHFRSTAGILLIIEPRPDDKNQQRNLLALRKMIIEQGDGAVKLIVASADTQTSDAAQRYEGRPGSFFLIRPDRYIALSGSLEQVQGLARHLNVGRRRFSAALEVCV